MQSDATLVVGVNRIVRPREGARAARSHVTVEFADGSKATLDAGTKRDQVWADVLQSLQQRRRPAFVKVDTESGRITLLLIPFEYRVVRIDETEWGDLRIEFDPSHAIHWLRRLHPQFDAIRALLEGALRSKRSVLVTESLDAPEIVDVREPG